MTTETKKIDKIAAVTILNGLFKNFETFSVVDKFLEGQNLNDYSQTQQGRIELATTFSRWALKNRYNITPRLLEDEDMAGDLQFARKMLGDYGSDLIC